MYDFEKNKVVESYARFMVQTKGVSTPYGCFFKMHTLHARHIPKDKSIVSHNGALTGDQKRRWGVDPFKKATRYKSKAVPKPANLYPCLLTAFDIEKSTGIPLSSLTIGHMQHQKGRSSVSALIYDLASWILEAPHESVKGDFFDMWDHLNEREMLHSLNWGSVLGNGLGSWFDEWNRLKGTKLVVTKELEEERDSNTQWGAW